MGVEFRGVRPSHEGNEAEIFIIAISEENKIFFHFRGQQFFWHFREKQILVHERLGDVLRGICTCLEKKKKDNQKSHMENCNL